MIKTDFIKLYEELSTLNEAKADTQRLIDFVGQDLADRFIALKQKLKSPENDLYYWIKNKTPEELEDFINERENKESKNKTKKNIALTGAELVHESEHWKIYHITTFEAAQMYGRDTQWCITGVGSYGDKYWNSYTEKGMTFYFAITKGDYDPRGTDSKFAFAINKLNRYYQVFDQQDSECYLEDIPYAEEITIPGINLDEYDTEEPAHCDYCGDMLSNDGDDTYWAPNGDILCPDCFSRYFFICPSCGETFHNDGKEGAEGTDGDMYCFDCWIDSFYECSQCWSVGNIEEAQYDENGEVYCPDCYEDYLESEADA